MDKFPEHITAIVGAGAVLDFKYDYSNAFIPLGEYPMSSDYGTI